MKLSDTPQEIEDTRFSAEEKESGPVDIKYDPHGLPLNPQPTDRPDDPLNWSKTLKWCILLNVAFSALIANAGAAAPNSALVAIAAYFHISVKQASYQATIFILFSGVSSLVIVPFANVYGRRPFYLAFGLTLAMSSIWSGASRSWTSMITARVFNGIGASASFALGAATVCDIFYQHERGFYIGIYTLFFTTGPHIAPLIGGFLAQYVNFRWCFYVPGIAQSATFVSLIFFLPETLFPREYVSAQSSPPLSYRQLLTIHRKIIPRKLDVQSFISPLSIANKLTILLPTLYYMTSFAFSSTVFGLSAASIAKTVYGFDTAQTGIFMSVPPTLGGLIGEATAGWISDIIVSRSAKSHDGHPEPEARLYQLPLALCQQIGLIISGICLQRKTHYIAVVIGFGIANF
ncbi:major facilitator superfamily domain-containing protein, partial [Lipomyces chichibuensis]|uniref:major facilitator superfamily domain-containing protein n=1 Tax=Lipomyces chichibuensis TaxID=1546026 RepID=UPI003343A30E